MNSWSRGIFYYAPQDVRIVVNERFRGTGIIPYYCTFNLAHFKGKLLFGSIVMFFWLGFATAYGILLYLSLDYLNKQY